MAAINMKGMTEAWKITLECALNDLSEGYPPEAESAVVVDESEEKKRRKKDRDDD